MRQGAAMLLLLVLAAAAPGARGSRRWWQLQWSEPAASAEGQHGPSPWVQGSPDPAIKTAQLPTCPPPPPPCSYDICVAPQQQERGTMRFNLLRGDAAPDASAYDFEFSIESCAGEIEEGLGGKLRCLSAFGGAIPTAPRRHIGRCVLVGNTAYSLNASSPEDRWEEVGPLLRAVVATFRK